MSDMDELFDQLDDGQPSQMIVPLQEVELTADTEMMSVDFEAKQAQPPVIDVREHVQRAGAILDEILSSWRSDRCNAQDAANLTRRIIDNTIAQGRDPSAGMVEQYVKALEVKANTNQTAVKCVDTIAKLVAATKPSTQVQNNNLVLGGTNKDLINVLKRPVMLEDP